MTISFQHALLTFTNLPELAGSEKQVNWALSIRSVYANGLALKFSHVLNKWSADKGVALDGNAECEAQIARGVAAFEKQFGEVLNNASAKFWIDNHA